MSIWGYSLLSALPLFFVHIPQFGVTTEKQRSKSRNDNFEWNMLIGSTLWKVSIMRMYYVCVGVVCYS